MPFNSRDLWVYLKAQDLASRALNSFSRNVKEAGAAVRIAQIEAEQASARAALAQGRLTGMTAQDRAAIQSHISTLQAERAQLVANGVEAENRINKMQRLSGTMRSVSMASFATGFALTALGVGGAIAMKSLIDASVEYDRQVRLTATQVDHFSGNFKQLGDIGLEVARNIGVGFDQIQPALYDIFSSMTVNITQAQKLLENFAKAAVAGQTDIQSVSRGTIAILNAFHMSADSINHVLDVQFMFIKKGVGTYDEWAQKIGQVSPSAARAGQSLDMMMAALALASREMGNTSRTTTAVARAFDAISNAKAVEALKKIGVAAADAHGNFRPFIDIMQDLRDKIDKIPGDVKKAAAIQEIFKGAGGTIEARKFLNNLLLVHGNLEDLKSIMGDVQNASGSLDSAYGVMADSAAVKTQLLKNRWQDLKITLGEALTPVLLKLIDIGNKVIGWFDNLSPKTKDMVAKFLALATAIGLIGGPLAIVFGVFSMIVAALAAAGPEIAAVAGIIVGVGIAIAAIGRAVTTAWKNSQPLRQLIKDLGKDISEVWNNDIKPFFHQIGEDFKKYVLPPLHNLWDTISNRIIPSVRQFWDEFWEKHKGSIKELFNDLRIVAKLGFEYLGKVINDFLIPILKWLQQQFEKHKTGIMQVVVWMQSWGKWILIIAGAAVIGALIASLIILVALIAIVIGIVGGLIWIFSQLAKFFTYVWHQFLDGCKQIGHAFWEVYHVMDQFGQAVNRKWDEFISWVKAIPGRIKGALGDFGSLLFGMGSDLIQGLINGVKNMAGSLISAARGVISDAISAAKNLLGQHSPSRVFHEIGVFTMQGFALGMKQGYKEALPEIKGLFGGLTTDLTATINTNMVANQPTNNRPIYLTINTQEIDPVKHAQELGALLAGRM